MTSTAAELNILDGVTSTATELNLLDGVTSTTAELNILDGVTSTAAELNILDGVTASATDINLIDGITNGTVIASKAIITDSNKDITGGRNITISGELDAATLDISGDIDVDGTTNLDVVDIDGAVDMASTLAVAGVVTANAGITVDNITIDGTEIDLSSGDLTLDVAGDIILDADGTQVILKDGGTEFGHLYNTNSDFGIKSTISDKDIKFVGNDGGSIITALTLDMSAAGAATFNSTVAATGINFAGDRAINNTNDTAYNIRTSSGSGSHYFGSGRTGFSGGIEIAKLGTTGTVFNDGGADIDFRVESDGQANMLFVDGGNNRVGINTGSPASGYMLHVGGSSGVHTKVKIEATTNTGQAELDLSADPAGVSYLNLGDEDSSNIGYLGYFHSDNSMRFQINAAERMRILSNGFIKHSNNGTYRDASGAFHEMTTSTVGGGFVSAFLHASYADGGIQVIATRASAGTTYRFFEGYSNNAADREFRVDSDGTVRADGAYSSAGGDYAEMFEWKDGNSSSEDRVGKTVVLDGNQIKLSTSDDAQATIIGVVSATPVVLGDAQDEKWIGKYETDSYGRYVLEEYTQTEWTEESDDGTKELKTYQTDMIPSDVTVPDDAIVTSEDENGVKLMRRKRNSSYDATQTYTPRVERKEFSAIGLVGKLRVTVGQTVGDRWIKMREISDTVHEYLVR